MTPSLTKLPTSVKPVVAKDEDVSTEAFPALTPSMAQQVVKQGSVAFSMVAAGGRLVDLLVDIDGVPSVPTFGTLRSIVGDSWIMTSNAIVPYAGTLDLPTAMIRAAVMLIAKRIWKIQQFGAVREAIVLLHFSKLAGTILKHRNQPMSDVLQEISAVPLFVYTAIAEVIRHTGVRFRDAMCTQLVQEVYTRFGAPITAPLRSQLEARWRHTIPAATRALHRSRIPKDPRMTLVEWESNI